MMVLMLLFLCSFFIVSAHTQESVSYNIAASGLIPVASSTCGETGPERVCDIIGLVCRICDRDDHSPSMMTDDSTETYWQSQTYQEITNRGVNITFNFHRTYIIDEVMITFHGPRPESFSLHVSDNGSFHPLHYFSKSCLETYNIAEGSSRSLAAVGCTSDGVGITPLSGGIARFKPMMMMRVVAKALQIQLDQLSTLGNEETWNSTVLDSYSYSISNVIVRGHCIGLGVVGLDCDECQDGFYQDPNSNQVKCMECSCNLRGSVDGKCNSTTGQCVCKSSEFLGRTCRSCDCHVMGTLSITDGCGECVCQAGVDGSNCDHCLPGYYNLTASGCVECPCHVNRSTGCDADTGLCICEAGYTGEDCSVELECPHCYDEIGYTFNETSALVGKFFSSAKFDEDFLINVNFTLYKLLELQELTQNITRRREYLQTRLDEIQKSLKRKEANQTRLSQILDQIFRISSSVETQSVANQMNITRVLDILTIVSNNLNIAERNVSIAQGLIEEILNIFSNLVNATNVLEIASFNQSVAVQAILQQAYILSDNATDVLADMCEILDMENSTLTLLEGLNDCATKELDSIIEQVETKLQIAIENASQVYSESNRLYKLVIDLVLPEGVDKLLNESRIALVNVNTVSTREAELHRNIQGLERLFMLLDISVQALSRRIGNLNETALDLIGRGEASLELANMTAIKTEGVINEIYNLSAYLEQKLKEFISFAGELENITKNVERAENISNISLATAEGQLTFIREIRRIINKSENLIKIIEETVIQAEKIINQTASQVNDTSVLVDVLRRNLTLLDGSVNNTERSIESLQDRGEKDRQAIERATSAINMTADKAGILEDGAAVIMNMLDQLEHDLNTTTLISEEEVNTLTQLLDNAQSKLDNNYDHLRNATMEVEQLEEQLKELEDKYDNIRLHRDLLVDIRQNLQQLNCQNEFA